MPQLSVIIPCLNEGGTLPGLLTQLAAQEDLDCEIIVADGGSEDDTCHRAQRAGARVISSSAGRAKQMNAGAAVANADFLLFLHADSRLPGRNLLSDALAALTPSGSNHAGHFGLRFVDIHAADSRFYAHLERKSRSGRPQTINGDQGLLIHRRFFEQLGGFDESLPFLEDQAISARIFEQGQWMLLPGHLETSARRFETEGRAARYFLMLLIMAAREAELSEFFTRARALYPEQGQTAALDPAPFLDLILELAETKPDFWAQMADYALDNAWQLPFAIDSALGREFLGPALMPLADSIPRSLGRAMLSPSLKWLFHGPVRQALKTVKNPVFAQRNKFFGNRH